MPTLPNSPKLNFRGQTPDPKARTPFVLLILDGWGIAPPGTGNAIAAAKTPTLDYLWKDYPHTKLYAHGTHVGLPDNQVGNSEAGHFNIGAGRVVKQDAVYISQAIKDGTFFKNPAFLKAIQNVEKNKSRLHIMGILSGEQCPHMSPEHILALTKLAADHRISVFLHFFTDGRDSPTHEALVFWKKLKQKVPLNACRVASVTGRLYLDRKMSWDRTETLYNALVLGKAPYEAESIEEAINRAYERGESDEFIEPTLIRSSEVTARDTISDNDSIIFYNLRSDRARQLTKPFVQENFEELNAGAFKRTKILKNIEFVAMTDFGPDLGPVLTAFPSRDVKNALPMALGAHYKQLYISEMEKYAHVTYFLNGGYEHPVAGENRILVRSKEVRSYDATPEMSGREITDVVLESLKNKFYNFICINLPNADMVGHTGNYNATVIACEAVDRYVGEILEVVREHNGEMIITADHGNAEIMRCVKKGAVSELINTMHETSPVPLYIYTDRPIIVKGQKEDKIGGSLSNIAPTLLQLVGIEKPKEMTGKSLII